MNFSPNHPKEIITLCDYRAGTAAQAQGLAQELQKIATKEFQENFSVQNIFLNYSFLAKLPNFFLPKSLWRFDKKSRKTLKNLSLNSAIIISSGRRTACAALYLKGKFPQNKVVQIMHPNLDFKKFDFVILPKHDQFSPKPDSNLITTIGSLSKIDSLNLAKEAEKFAATIGRNSEKKAAVLLGGPSKNSEFTISDAKDFAKICSEIAVKNDLKLMILNSRRSGKNLTQEFIKNLDCSFQLFDWEEVKNNNPYAAILYFCDYFIVSGDSVSMISECCSTGKPVYIFDQNLISSKKHRLFHQELFQNGYAKIFDAKTKNLENFSNKKLNETKRVASEILTNILPISK